MKPHYGVFLCTKTNRLENPLWLKSVIIISIHVHPN